MLILSLAFVMFFSQDGATAPLATQPAWAQRAQQHQEELVRINGGGTNAALRDELKAMGQADQNGRAFIGPAPSKSGEAPKNLKIYTAAGNVSDDDLTQHLKHIVNTNGWPTIAQVGVQASDAALLILRHSSDLEWQRSLLPELEKLAAENKIDVSVLALVIDYSLISNGKPQRYGTQFKTFKKAKAMYAVEKPSELDVRRASVFLPPIAFYKEMMAKAYGLRILTHTVPPSSN